MVPGFDGVVSPPAGMVVDAMSAASALVPIAIEAAESPVSFLSDCPFFISSMDFLKNCELLIVVKQFIYDFRV
jgi:hypothetical protein